jgi:hypothetical protein
MKRPITMLLACLLAAPALAASYPVGGRWGESNGTEKGAIDCASRRVVDFQGERRFDSGGGVPEYRAIKLIPQGASAFRITEEFHTGQVRAQTTYTLRTIDADRIELNLRPGGTLKLQRCK